MYCKNWEDFEPVKVIVYKFCNMTEYYNIENCLDGIGEKDPFAVNTRGIHIHSGSNQYKVYFFSLMFLSIIIYQ